MNNRFEIIGDITKIFCLTNDGKEIEVIVDTAKLSDISRLNSLFAAKILNRNGHYIKVNLPLGDNKYKGSYLHRVLCNCPENMEVDHVNRNTLDNRLCNLNIVTKSQNAQNKSKRSSNKTGYIGVQKRGIKYHSKIGHDNKMHFLGSFLTKGQAIARRIVAENKIWAYAKEHKKYYKTLPGVYYVKNYEGYLNCVIKKRMLMSLIDGQKLIRLLKVSRQRIEQYRKHGMPSVKLDGANEYYYEKAEVLKWLESNTFQNKKYCGIK